MKLAIALMGATLLFNSAMAQQKDVIVANIEALKGKVLIENTEGKRTIAKAKTKLKEGQKLLILENAEISLKYTTSECKIMHRGHALLSVSEKTQCAPAQEMGVGFAPGTANSFTATGQSFGTQGGTSFSNAGTSFFAGSTWIWAPIAAATTLIIVITDDDEPPVSP